MVRLMTVLVLSVVALASMSACSSGTDSDDDTDNGDVLESGESLGAIDRLPGGTPVSVDVRVLLTADCAAGVLTVRTEQEQITAKMDCRQMLPQTILDRFLGQPVAIRAGDGRLIIENPTEGTLDFPATEPRVTEVDGAP